MPEFYIYSGQKYDYMLSCWKCKSCFIDYKYEMASLQFPWYRHRNAYQSLCHKDYDPSKTHLHNLDTVLREASRKCDSFSQPQVTGK